MPRLESLDLTVRRIISEAKLDLEKSLKVYSEAVKLYGRIPETAMRVARSKGRAIIDEDIYTETLKELADDPAIQGNKYLQQALFLEREQVQRQIVLRQIADVIREPEYKEKTLNWGDVCVDTSYHVLDAFFTIHRIEKLKKPELSGSHEEILKMTYQWPKDFDVDFLKGVDIERFLFSVFDEYRCGFAQKPGLQPDIYSTDSACRIIFDFMKEERLVEKITRIFRGIYGFVNSCQDEATGAFSDRPFMAPAAAITFSATHILTRLHKWFKNKDPSIQLDVTTQKIIHFLTKDCIRKSEDTIAFADNSIDDPMTCSTYYSLMAMKILLEFQSKQLKEIINENTGKGILEFIRKCWSKQEGAYKSGINAEKASLVHTGYALMTLRELCQESILERDQIVENLQPERVVSYLRSCYKDGGFSPAVGIVPTAYSTRAALRIIKFFEQNRILDHMAVSPAYMNAIQEFDLNKIKHFLASCYNAKMQGYSGLPILAYSA